MKESHWNEIEEAFERLSASSSTERATELERLRSTNPELAAELTSLLAAHERVTDGIEAPALPGFEGASERQLAKIVGTRIGPYEITRLIGTGGMGVVFEARRADGYFQRNVAIKILHVVVKEETSGRRFLAEGALLARLDHANIVSLLDAGMLAEERPYFVMEYVEGEDLARHCKNLSLRRRIDLFRTVCRAVSAAHARLVVHLDLKPSNILVARDGQPKLVDFGIARLVGASSPEDSSALRPLTPEYASPEQLRGEPPSTASDVFALGRILANLIEAVHADDSGTNTPPDLLAIVQRATAESPEERYGSVDRLEEDLRRYLEGLPVDARRTPHAVRAAKWIARNRWPCAAACVVFLSLVVATWSALRTLEATRAHAVLGWQAHAQALRFSGVLQRVLLDLPDTGSDGLLAMLETEAERSMSAWGDLPEARGRTHEALGVAHLKRGSLARAREHFELALEFAKGDPGFDSSDLSRVRRHITSMDQRWPE